jgi:hypothetical protein
MAATVQQILSTRTATRASTGISRPTSLGDGQILLVNSDGQRQRKSAKTKRNELKFVLGLDKDGKKEEKMVKELLTEVNEPKKVTLSRLLEPAVPSQSAAADGSDDIAAVRSDAHHQPVIQKHQSPVRLHRAEGDRRTHGVLRNHLQREAVINAWQDEQSKVNPPISSFIH